MDVRTGTSSLMRVVGAGLLLLTACCSGGDGEPDGAGHNDAVVINDGATRDNASQDGTAPDGATPESGALDSADPDTVPPVTVTTTHIAGARLVPQLARQAGPALGGLTTFCARASRTLWSSSLGPPFTRKRAYDTDPLRIGMATDYARFTGPPGGSAGCPQDRPGGLGLVA